MKAVTGVIDSRKHMKRLKEHLATASQLDPSHRFYLLEVPKDHRSHIEIYSGPNGEEDLKTAHKEYMKVRKDASKTRNASKAAQALVKLASNAHALTKELDPVPIQPNPIAHKVWELAHENLPTGMSQAEFLAFLNPFRNKRLLTAGVLRKVFKGQTPQYETLYQVILQRVAEDPNLPP